MFNGLNRYAVQTADGSKKQQKCGRWKISTFSATACAASGSRSGLSHTIRPTPNTSSTKRSISRSSPGTSFSRRRTKTISGCWRSIRTTPCSANRTRPRTRTITASIRSGIGARGSKDWCTRITAKSSRCRARRRPTGWTSGGTIRSRSARSPWWMNSERTASSFTSRRCFMP